MLPDSIQKWINDRLVDAKIKFPGGVEVTLKNPRTVQNRADAIAGFVAAALETKKEALALNNESNSKKFGDRLVILTEFVGLHHGLMPNGQWKQTLPEAINRIVATRNQQQAGMPMDRALVQLKADIEHLVDTIDQALGELSS